MSDWFDLRRQARRDIHTAFSVAATYTDSTLSEPVELHMRWHTKFGDAVGDISGGDYARVLASIDKLIFDIDELTEKGLTPKRGGEVSLIDYVVTFKLDVREPNDGPLKVVWTITP